VQILCAAGARRWRCLMFVEMEPVDVELAGRLRHKRLLRYDDFSFAATEWIKGKAMDEALKIKNT
jgi:hypothetical protein